MARLTVEQAISRARSHEKKGEVAAARAVLAEVLAAYPGNARARAALAALAPPANPPAAQMQALMALWERGQAAATAERARALLRDFPASPALWNLLGAASGRCGQPDEAVAAFARVTQLLPDHAEGHANLGRALLDHDRPAEAAPALRRALDLSPGHPGALNNLANASRALGQTGQAIALWQDLLRTHPGHADAHLNLGHALAEAGRGEEAVAAYAQALRLRPGDAEAHRAQSKALLALGQAEAAEAASRRALALKPDDAAIHVALANALAAQAREDEAIRVQLRAIEIEPDLADAHNGLAALLVLKSRPDAAIAAYRRVLELYPEDALVRGHMLHQMRHICDWSELAGDGPPALPSPFAVLSEVDDPEQHLRAAQQSAARHYTLPPAPLPARPASRPARLRLGYFGADFHDHATMYLMAGLLREHDRAAVEVFAYSYGHTRTGEMRQQAEASIEHFHDVADLSDRAIADLARSHGLDVAVDLKGHTAHNRARLFQLRPAPVQVSYLGYPGTMAVEFLDYIVADPVVIPQAQRQHYTERVIWLPHSYQPNDDRRPVAAGAGTRAEHGLPEAGVVFCCLNATYKIGPREFDVWMRLMDRVPGSVLWLLRSNDWAEANLRREAAARGIDPDRLVLAGKLPAAEHLARLRYADLFLDTFNYNAHTTASDALWAGVPVLTRQGRGFAARVGASLLTAVDLPELITATEAEYEGLALALATDPGRLAALRARLAANRATQPLFDSRRYARNLESGLRQAWETWFAGRPPQDIRVTEG